MMAPPPTEIKYPPSHAAHHKSKRRGHYAELALAAGEERKQKLKMATHKYVDLLHAKLSKVCLILFALAGHVVGNLWFVLAIGLCWP